jgi:hypothetical protein
LPVLDFLIPLVVRIYPIYRAHTVVIAFAHALRSHMRSFSYTRDRRFSNFVAKWDCERLGRNYISSKILKPLARPRSRSEDNIKMHLTGIGWD